jgi:hypothetical protein
MQFSAKQFGEIVTRLGADAADPIFAGGDQRRAHRVELSNRVTIVPYADGQPRAGVGVELRDVSPRGLRFLHSQQLPVGAQFVLELAQAGGDPLTILCTVAHSEPTPQGPFSTGAEFTCVLPAGGKPGKPAPQPSALNRLNEQDRIRHSILD